MEPGVGIALLAEVCVCIIGLDAELCACAGLCMDMPRGLGASGRTEEPLGCMA